MLNPLRLFFSEHPLLFLILISPQVEYLTGSSPLSWAVGNPPFFIAFFFQNLGSYGLAVVLIREAQIRWRKGWASILLMGAAYGILNEGIGAATLFNPDTMMGSLGSYGRWLGVNWVWTTGLVLLVHPLYSVTLPLLEHRISFPGIKEKSLITNRGVKLAFAGLGIDALGTLIFVSTIRHFSAGPILWTASCAAMIAFVAAARLVPKDLLPVLSSLPRARPYRFFLVGALLIWAVTLGGDFLIHLAVYAVLVSVFFVTLGGLVLLWVFRSVGQSRNRRHKISLAAGLVASLAPMGFFGQLGSGIGIIPVIAFDLLASLFFFHLWRSTTPDSQE